MLCIGKPGRSGWGVNVIHESLPAAVRLGPRRRRISLCCSTGFQKAARASGLKRKKRSGEEVRILAITMPTHTLAMVLAECSRLMHMSAVTPAARSARVPAPPYLWATTGHTSTSPLSGAPARTTASTAFTIAAMPPLSSCAPIAPDPAVLELRPVGVDAPAAHLHPGVHVAVQHEGRAAPGAAQPADRLPAGDGRVAGARHLHHLDLEPDPGHVLGEVVGDLLLLEGRAGNANERLLQGQDPLRVHEALDLGVRSGGCRS